MTVLKYQPEMEKQETEHPGSFESLYHQYHIRIYRYLRAHLKNDDDAADLTQQVFSRSGCAYRPTNRQKDLFRPGYLASPAIA